MSFTRTPNAAMTRRQAHQLTKQLTAKLTGKQRGPDPEVRRDSYDVDDRRAQVFHPIGDGSRAGALGWIDCVLKVARDYDDLERAKGGARPLGHTAILVLEVLLGRRGRSRIPIDFRTGRLDPAIDTIAQAAGLARITVVRALHRLKDKGFLCWVRRTRRTGAEVGPQREQTSNAYFFEWGRMAKNVRQRLMDLLRAKRVAQANRAADGPPACPAPSPPGEPQNPSLRAALRALDRVVPGASTTSSPAIPVQG